MSGHGLQAVRGVQERTGCTGSVHGSTAICKALLDCAPLHLDVCLKCMFSPSRSRGTAHICIWMCVQLGCFGYTHQSPAGDLFAVSVVGCLLGYSSCLVVWIPLFLDPSDGVFGRFDLAALCGCRTLNKQNKQKFKVRQPQRAARSKRPNTPSDGSKNNGIHTTKQEEYPSRHPTTDTANKSPAGD